MILLAGKVCRLRPLQRADAQRTRVWRNDPEIRDAILGYRFPVTEIMESQWYEKLLSDPGGARALFGIEDLSDESLAGYIQLTAIEWIHRTGILGISIGDKSRHGRGIGSEAILLMLRYAFDCLNLRKIRSEVVGFNQRALRLHVRLGFREEGRLKEQIYLEGAYHDLHQMAILEREFRQRDEIPRS